MSGRQTRRINWTTAPVTSDMMIRKEPPTRTAEPQDVQLRLPDGTSIGPSETRRVETELGVRWEYTFRQEDTGIQPVRGRDWWSIRDTLRRPS